MMAAPRNPYRDERPPAAMPMGDSDTWSRARGRGPEPPIEAAVGLHSIDLHNLAVRNFRAGVAQAERTLSGRIAELEEGRAQAWDEGVAAGELASDWRARVQVESILSLIEATLTDAGVGRGKRAEPEARLAKALTLVEGALVVLVTNPEVVADDEDAAKPKGLTVAGFTALEKVLTDAAVEKDSTQED